ncbi:hypothetical protein, partial [Streptomyces rochei]|uniref:hypothetical protein n=1 Tax=Streptomyces rochei TaxID=1928 RepID=UPI00342ED987
ISGAERALHRALPVTTKLRRGLLWGIRPRGGRLLGGRGRERQRSPVERRSAAWTSRSTSSG